MYYKKINVTPENSREWLMGGVTNRPLKTKRVEAIAADILSGKWHETPQVISFDKEGKLIDGQHRMAAVIKANQTVPMWACFDVDRDTVIDRGVPRSTSDSLYIRGIVDRKLATASVVAIVRLYHCVEAGRSYMTDDQIAEFIIANKDWLKMTMDVTSLRGSHLCRSTSVRTGIFAALKEGVPVDKIRDFVYVTSTGFMNEPSQSSAVLLRSFLQENHAKTYGERNRLLALTQTAIADFANGTPRTKKYQKISHTYIKSRMLA